MTFKWLHAIRKGWKCAQSLLWWGLNYAGYIREDFLQLVKTKTCYSCLHSYLGNFTHCLQIHCLETHRAWEFQKIMRDSSWWLEIQLTCQYVSAIVVEILFAPRKQLEKGRCSAISHHPCQGAGELRAGASVTSRLLGWPPWPDGSPAHPQRRGWLTWSRCTGRSHTAGRCAPGGGGAFQRPVCELLPLTWSPASAMGPEAPRWAPSDAGLPPAACQAAFLCHLPRSPAPQGGHSCLHLHLREEVARAQRGEVIQVTHTQPGFQSNCAASLFLDAFVYPPQLIPSDWKPSYTLTPAHTHNEHNTHLIGVSQGTLNAHTINMHSYHHSGRGSLAVPYTHMSLLCRLSHARLLCPPAQTEPTPPKPQDSSKVGRGCQSLGKSLKCISAKCENPSHEWTNLPLDCC